MTRDEYYRNHRWCPQCGSGCEQTTIGYIWTEVNYRDGNRAFCVCGWKGTVHDLVGTCPLPDCDKAVGPDFGRGLVCEDHGRQYAMLQADGRCMGCGDPLPKDGDATLCEKCEETAKAHQFRAEGKFN